MHFDNVRTYVFCYQQVSTKFSDLFAFGGPVPERINGRLAMVGFVAAMAVELYRGQDLSVQISGQRWDLDPMFPRNYHCAITCMHL